VITRRVAESVIALTLFTESKNREVSGLLPGNTLPRVMVFSTTLSTRPRF